MRNSTRDELITSLERRIERLEEEFGKHYRQSHNGEDKFAECEICGCMVFKNYDTKGKGEVRQRGGSYSVDEDFIYYPYYCKLHKPKPAIIKPRGN